MPKDGDFKRLVRARMAETAERYTEARAALERASERVQLQDRLDDDVRSVVGQLGHPDTMWPSFARLVALPEDVRREAALFGLAHDNWRVRRSCARLLDDITLTPESITRLQAALEDEHPKVRRAALHTLSCRHCKPDGCALDERPLLERMADDPSRIVRGMVVTSCWPYDEQWCVDLLAKIANGDPSDDLRTQAQSTLDSLRAKWDSDAARRRLPDDLRTKTERHTGRWVAIRDGRIVAVRNGQARVFTRAVRSGATPYWVAPHGKTPPVLGARNGP